MSGRFIHDPRLGGGSTSSNSDSSHLTHRSSGGLSSEGRGFLGYNNGQDQDNDYTLVGDQVEGSLPRRTPSLALPNHNERRRRERSPTTLGPGRTWLILGILTLIGLFVLGYLSWIFIVSKAGVLGESSSGT